MTTKIDKITKVLIANRGEIAIRIMRTAKKIGIKTVAIASDADRDSYFTTLADEVVNIGGILPRESYLDIDKIVAAIEQTGANAVHPGYGFLAENESFAKTIENLGIYFVGPSSKSIGAMGDKVSSKKLAMEAGVSVVPGFVGSVPSVSKLNEVVKDIGFPVMIKASAGGGGKGMRIVYKQEDLKDAFENCVSEAKKNFKDDRVFVEKFIENPRHIEVQVLGDKHGNLVCLGERECSIQRFNQKIVEEAPSMFVDEKMREKMYHETKLLAKSCGYFSAGTVEYVVDQNKNFYFLEMNTRLQVEHGVSEMITGIDIVEQMFKVAEGEKLPFTQKDINLSGWAIETRICAEDTANGFAPSSGRITRYLCPNEKHNLRVETTYMHGGHVSPFYDAMIAKLVSYGDTRNEAILEMRNALGNYAVEGIKTNISLLEAIMMNPDFESGNLSTAFIKKHYSKGFGGLPINDEVVFAFIFASVLLHCTEKEKFSNMGCHISALPGEVAETDVMHFYVVINSSNESEQAQEFGILLKESCTESGRFVISINGSEPVEFFANFGRNSMVKIFFDNKKIDGESVKVSHLLGSKYRMSFRASSTNVAIYPLHVMPLIVHMPKIDEGDIENTKHLTSPMTGLVTSIKVVVGQEVKKGQCLATVEAMKMENFISIATDGVVKQIMKNVGDVISAGDLLIELE